VKRRHRTKGRWGTLVKFPKEKTVGKQENTRKRVRVKRTACVQGAYTSEILKEKKKRKLK